MQECVLGPTPYNTRQELPRSLDSPWKWTGMLAGQAQLPEQCAVAICDSIAPHPPPHPLRNWFPGQGGIVSAGEQHLELQRWPGAGHVLSPLHRWRMQKQAQAGHLGEVSGLIGQASTSAHTPIQLVVGSPMSDARICLKERALQKDLSSIGLHAMH